MLLLWENLHGGFLLALAATLIWAIWAWRTRDLPARAWIPVAGLPLVLGLTPWGWGLVAHAVAESLAPAISGSIAEWASPNFHDPFWILFLGAPALALGVNAWLLVVAS
jgi:hypothetical protein